MSVPSLESLLAEYIATQAPVSVEQAMPQAEDMAKLIRASRILTTIGQLEALPSGAVVMDVDGTALRKNPYELSSDLQRWYPAWIVGNTHECDMGVYADMVDLPATVLWVPADGAEDQQ